MRSNISKFLASLEVEFKEEWRSGELIFLLVLLYFFQGLFALIALSMPKEDDLFLSLSGFRDSVLYQLAGMPVLFVSLIATSSMTDYLATLGRRGLVEALSFTPSDRRINLAAHSASQGAVLIFYYLSISAPSVALRAGLETTVNLLPAMLILALGIVPLILVGFTVANVALRFRGQVISELVNSAVFTFTGIVYPLTIFPPLVQLISQLLPHGHVAEAVRAAVYYGLLTPAQSWALLLAVVGYGILASFLYSSLERGIRRRGLYEAPTE